MPCEEEYLFNQRVVSLGGGTGHYTWLRGAIKCNNPELITAVPGTWDSGGVSGEQRIEEGILPPGDYIQCLFALMEDDSQVKAAIALLRDRTEGYPLLHKLAAKAEKVYHGVDRGIDGLRDLFRVRARIDPVTLLDIDLCADTSKGKSFCSEHQIDEIKNDSYFHLEDEITRIYFDKPAEANPKVIKSITEADKIILPPGSPYTSIFPHLLVGGIVEAIINSSARMVAVLNLMTTEGEDHHLTSASRWLKVLQYYLHDEEWIVKTGKSKINYLVVNESHIDTEVVSIYERKGQLQIKIDEEECTKSAPGLMVVRKNLAKYDRTSHLLRHESVELAKIVLSLP